MTRCRYCNAPIEPLATDTGHNPPRIIWTHHQNGEHYERCLPDWADAPTMRAEPMTDPDHHLELLNEGATGNPDEPGFRYTPPRGRCSCGWLMIGPHDLIRQFHRTHLKETTP